MAKYFGDDADVKQRLEELSALEAEIIHRGDSLPRMHS
jgi:tRNA isopentenyl-2-thiomethyl-A-37 hydroxylase MiaE